MDLVFRFRLIMLVLRVIVFTFGKKMELQLVGLMKFSVFLHGERLNPINRMEMPMPLN